LEKESHQLAATPPATDAISNGLSDASPVPLWDADGMTDLQRVADRLETNSHSITTEENDVFRAEADAIARKLQLLLQSENLQRDPAETPRSRSTDEPNP
jgi:hypothetical protein